MIISKTITSIFIYITLILVIPFRSVIRSVVQVAKPIFSSSLLQLKEPVTFSATSRVAKARLVQKWAYLRLENTSAAVVIESLALRLGNLKKDFDEMLQRLVELRAGQHITPSDEVSLNNMEVYKFMNCGIFWYFEKIVHAKIFTKTRAFCSRQWALVE